MKKKAVRISQETCIVMFLFLFSGSFLFLSIFGGGWERIADACSKNVITLVKENGDGTGQYRINLAEGSCTFHITLFSGEKKGKMRATESGGYCYEFPGTAARLMVDLRLCRGTAEFGQCLDRDASYYRRNAAEYGSGYRYAGTGWMTRTESFACPRFRLRREGGEKETGYAACAVVYVRSEQAEYRFVLEAVSREEADLFSGSFVFTPRSD